MYIIIHIMQSACVKYPGICKYMQSIHKHIYTKVSACFPASVLSLNPRWLLKHVREAPVARLKAEGGHRALVRAVIGARTITTHSWAKLRELATMLAKRICRASVPVLALRARPTTALVYCAQPRRWRTAEPSHSGTGCGRRRAMDLREED